MGRRKVTPRKCPNCGETGAHYLFCPSPEQIRERARAIRDSWTPAEEAVRRVGARLVEIELAERWTPPYTEVIY